MSKDRVILSHEDADKPCQTCPLYEKGAKRVWAEAPSEGEVELVIVSSYPSKEEESLGKPFVGKGGHLIRDIVKKSGVPLSKIAFTHAVKCRSNKKEPSSAALVQCGKYLRKELKVLNPTTVVALGNVAMTALDVPADSLVEARLNAFAHVPHPRPWSPKKRKRLEAKRKDPERKLAVVSTYAPEYVLRNPSYISALRDDLQNKTASIVANRGKFISERGARKAEITFIKSVKEVREFVDFVLYDEENKDDYVAFDYESFNTSWHAKVNSPLTVGFSFAGDEVNGYSIPLHHPETPFDASELKKVSKLLRKLFRSKNAVFRGWIAHNAQFENFMTHGHFGTWIGVAGDKPLLDTQIIANLYDENRKNLGIQYPYSLEVLTSEFLGYEYVENLKNERDRLASIDLDRVLHYNGEDAVVTGRLFNELMERASKESSPPRKHAKTGEIIEETYDKTILRLAEKKYSRTLRYACTMRVNGQLMDVDHLQALRQEDSIIAGRLRYIKNKFRKSKYVKKVEKMLAEESHGGAMDKMFADSSDEGVFSLTKKDHVRTLFFDVMGLEPVKNSDSGTPSVDKNFQEHYAPRDKEGALMPNAVPLVGLYQEFQALDKLDSSYLSPIGEWLQTRECADGRLHPEFKLTSTVTGRASAANPNCYDAETEVLTPGGWVRFDELEDGVPVAMWTKGEVVFVVPSSYTRQRYRGDMYALEGEYTDLLITHNHTTPLMHRSGEIVSFSAREYPAGDESWYQMHAGNFRHLRDISPFIYAVNDSTLAEKDVYEFYDRTSADSAQAALALLNLRTKLTEENGKFRLTFSRDPFSNLKEIEKKKIRWDDMIYCVTVPSHTILVRRRGKVMVSHQTQQLPRSDSAPKRAIKCLFTAPEDSYIVQIDYSQAEVRWLGIISDDQSLAKRYMIAEELKEEYIRKPSDELKRRIDTEGDIHMATALSMYNLPMDLPFTDPKRAKDARQRAKSVCFGLIYGKHWKTLARDLGIEPEESKEMVDKWMKQFPQAAKWLEYIEEFVSKHGWVQSPLGRRRRLPEVFSDDPGVANRAKRQARNSPIQGAASDTNFYAAGKLMERIERDEKLAGVLLTNTVHDSIVAEVPTDALMTFCKVAKAICTDQDLLLEDFGIRLTVPLAVDFEVGPNWGTLIDFDLTKKSEKRIHHDCKVMRKFPTGTTWKDLEKKGLLYAQKENA